MTTEFSGGKFAWQVARRGAIFLVLIFGVPLALYAADKTSDPRTDVTLTEAIRVTTATPIGFYAYLLLVLSLIQPIWKHMKSLGLPRYWGSIVPLLMLSDWPYFIAAHSAGIFGASMSSLNGQLPLYLVTAIALMVAMSVAHPAPAGGSHGRRFGFVGAGAVVLAVWICLGTAFIVGMANWLHLIQSLGPDEAPHPLFVLMIVGSAWVSILNPCVCAVFVGLVAWCVVLSRRPACRTRS